MELVRALAADYSLVCFFDLDSGMGSALRNDDGDGSLFGKVFDGDIELKQSISLYASDFVHEDDRKMFLQGFTQETIRKELQDKKI